MQFDGLLQLSPWGLAGATLLLTHITIASVTIFLHRHQAHRALTLHPLVSHFFRFWLWLTTGMVTREWVAVHRKHHARCETEDDPHSPQTRGILRVLLGGAGLYHHEAKNDDTLAKYGQGTPDDWIERRLYGRHRHLGIAMMLVIDLVLFGPLGLGVYLIQMLWIPFWAAGVINGLGHYWGYRSFETPDASRNLTPLGVLIGGEELHNNHHAYAQSARLSSKWWELDIGWVYIRILELLGLAVVKRTAPRPRMVSGKHTVDTDTVRAVMRTRFHIMKLYGCKVIGPVMRAERRTANHMLRRELRRVRRSMSREDLALDMHNSVTLNEALKHSEVLRTVYHFKQSLKDLWTRSTLDSAARVRHLQRWCTEAEQTGIQVLHDFARSLRRHTVQAT